MFLNISVSLARESIPVDDELNFAVKYFKTLYDYDIQATSFANSARDIKTDKQLLKLFLKQKAFVSNTIDKLALFKPLENYSSSYSSVMQGLKMQEEYLDSITKDLKAGYTFDIAFASNNWKFFKAKKLLEAGINDFKVVLATYNYKSQLYIIASTGVSEQQLLKDATESEYIKTIQKGVNNN